MTSRQSIVLLSLVMTLASIGAVHAASNAKVPVLLYHQISTPSKPIPLSDEVIDVEQFAQQMEYLHVHEYRTISTAALVRFMEGREEIPERSVVIHFDDGSISVLRAVPILQKYNFKAAFWIVAGKDIGKNHLDWSDILHLSQNKNFEIYSHSLTHAWGAVGNFVDWADGKVPGRSIHDVERELQESKKILELRLGRPIPYFAWPFNAYNDKLINVALRSGYSALFTVDWGGPNQLGGDVLHIRRAFVSGLCGMDTFKMILTIGHSFTCNGPPNHDGRKN